MHKLSHINLRPAKSDRLDCLNLFWFPSYNCVSSGVVQCQTFHGQSSLRQQATAFSSLFYGLFGWMFLVLQEYFAQTCKAAASAKLRCPLKPNTGSTRATTPPPPPHLQPPL